MGMESVSEERSGGITESGSEEGDKDASLSSSVGYMISALGERKKQIGDAKRSK